VTFYDRYIALCGQLDMSPSAVALDIGLSKPAVNRWKNGTRPTDATVAKIAAYFGVPVEHLMYGSPLPAITATDHSVVVQGNTGNTTVTQGETLTEQETELLRLFRSLNMRWKHAAMAYMYELEDKHLGGDNNR